MLVVGNYGGNEKWLEHIGWSEGLPIRRSWVRILPSAGLYASTFVSNIPSYQSVLKEPHLYFSRES